MCLQGEYKFETNYFSYLAMKHVEGRDKKKNLKHYKNDEKSNLAELKRLLFIKLTADLLRWFRQVYLCARSAR